MLKTYKIYNLEVGASEVNATIQEYLEQKLDSRLFMADGELKKNVIKLLIEKGDGKLVLLFILFMKRLLTHLASGGRAC